MATMADLDELALSFPQATKDVSAEGRPEYLVHGKLSAAIAAAGATRSILTLKNVSTTCSCSGSPTSG